MVRNHAVDAGSLRGDQAPVRPRPTAERPPPRRPSRRRPGRHPPNRGMGLGGAAVQDARRRYGCGGRTRKATARSGTAAAPEDGLPVLPELAAVLAARGARGDPEPVGGGPALREAACGYWERRGLPADPDDVAAAPGAPAPAARADSPRIGGDVLVPRPCAAWWAPAGPAAGPARLPCARPRPSAAASPTRTRCWRPYAGSAPRAATRGCCCCPSPTTRPPPSPRPNWCTRPARPPSARGCTSSATRPGATPCTDPHDTVLLSPAEMLPERRHRRSPTWPAPSLPPGWPAAVARFPATDAGRRPARPRRSTSSPRSAPASPPRSPRPPRYALDEPDAGHRPASPPPSACTRAWPPPRTAPSLAAGALARPPQAGRHLYADLGPLRPALAARGVGDSMELEDYLTRPARHARARRPPVRRRARAPCACGCPPAPLLGADAASSARSPSPRRTRWNCRMWRRALSAVRSRPSTNSASTTLQRRESSRDDGSSPSSTTQHRAPDAPATARRAADGRPRRSAPPAPRRPPPRALADPARSASGASGRAPSPTG